MKRHSKAWWLTPLAIQHWKRLRDDPDSADVLGAMDCPYCQSFDIGSDEDEGDSWESCSGCPLKKAPNQKDRCGTEDGYYERTHHVFLSSPMPLRAEGAPRGLSGSTPATTCFASCSGRGAGASEREVHPHG